MTEIDDHPTPSEAHQTTDSCAVAYTDPDTDPDALRRDPVALGGLWLTGQTALRTQRRGYVAGSSAHPAKMAPAIAARAIATYAHPGGLVLDPMCGIGTTLVEARRAGHPSIGVEYEPRWADLARANLTRANLTAAVETAPGPTPAAVGSDPVESCPAGSAPVGSGPVEAPGWVVGGDARDLEALLPAELAGHVDLVVTSPPYGPSTHGHLTNPRGEPIRKVNHQYGSPLDRGNLANIGHYRLLTGFTRILRAAAVFLRPGGHVVITARPWREHGELIDLPSQVFGCGRAAGLVPVARHVALLGRVTDQGGFVARGSFFQRDLISKRRAAGLPLHLIAHEDVLVLQRPR